MSSIGSMSREGWESTRGSLGRTSKLTEEIVREILASPESYAVLAKRYGVSATCIRDIKTRKRWRHVEL